MEKVIPLIKSFKTIFYFKILSLIISFLDQIKIEGFKLYLKPCERIQIILNSRWVLCCGPPVSLSFPLPP
jgi:hypothetical protein